MFGNARMDAVLGSVDGSVRFYGLTPTSMKLEGLERHQRLLDSYKNCTPPAPKLSGKLIPRQPNGCAEHGVSVLSPVICLI
jgi:hypothetical protein